MKKLAVTTVIIVFLMFLFNGIQGQTTQPQLDQLKLLRQHLGYWQLVANKDTTWLVESQLNGNIEIDYVYLIIKGTKSPNQVLVYSYFPEEKKFNGITIMQNGMYMTWKGSWVSENKFVVNGMVNYNPDQPIFNAEVLYDTPKSMIMTEYSVNGVKLGEHKYTKVN